MPVNRHKLGPIDAKGAYLDDFILTDYLLPEQVPAAIERDRPFITARPGFVRKLLPLRVDLASGINYCGGRYLLKTYEEAVALGSWFEHEFEMDGVPFLERPDFEDVQGKAYQVVGAYDFTAIDESQTAFRTEIWHVQDASLLKQMPAIWPVWRDRAESEGRSALWLMYNEDSRDIAVVTVWNKVKGAPTDELDFVTLDAIDSAPSYGIEWETQGKAEKIFSRSTWVYTVWFPNDERAESPLWPNSPPLPAPND